MSSFSEATRDVLGQLFERPVRVSPPWLLTAPVPGCEVCVVVGLNGEADGRVLFEMSQATALSLAGVMSLGAVFTELNASVRSCVSELGNIVAGRAVSLFNGQGGHLGIGAPMLLRGLGMRASHDEPVTRIVAETVAGEFLVNLSLRRPPDE
ncbi:MAG: chemotaxis protein CheX [Candidatus Eremiobacterota bacterium]